MNRPPLGERIIENAIRVSAGVAIVGLILIFVFIGKEALPLFTSHEARQEASLSKLFIAQVPEEGEPPSHMWQPVSELPKYSLWPLIIGTLESDRGGVGVCVSFGAGGGAVHLRIRPALVEGNRQTRH
jgi:phosphate transport system permease protein